MASGKRSLSDGDIPDWVIGSDFNRPDPMTPLFDSLWHVHCMGDDQPEPPVARAATRRTASAVLTDNGILRAPEVVELAAAAGLELAAAAVLLEKESGGGRNVWGHDAVNTAGSYIKGSPVTKEAYFAYRDAVHARHAGRQGVGPCQLTYGPFQDEADALGGCWDWRCNVRVGFRILAQGIKAGGIRAGFRQYNGSGPAAERYANDAMAHLAVWRTRLAGCGPEGDDEMNAEQEAKLDRVLGFVNSLYQQSSGSLELGHWDGWPSFPEGSGYSLSQTDYLRQADVSLNDILKAVGSLQNEVAQLRARLP